MSHSIRHLNEVLAGRYRVERELGAGGMATVYLADDLKHARKVALKVLEPELASVVGGRRFLTEIRTTANLQHPHILPLHDSGDENGLLYYVMPYVDGESLRHRLEREHQLPIDEAVQIAIDLARGLDYAHRQGVIHRDVKPANVLLLDGRPVISDFGIALAVSAGGAVRVTETGMLLGTPHYMSPEQATGDPGVGPAADLFALGCVLYEMIAGEPPFKGSTPQAVLGKIATGSPTPLREARGSVPAHVEAAVARALEKVPADRFRTGSDFARALQNPAFRHGPPRNGHLPVTGWKWATLGASLAAAIFAVLYLGGAGPSIPDGAASVERFALEVGPGLAAVAAIPDGSGVVFAHSGQLHVRRWADLAVTPVPGATGDRVDPTASVSPGGDSVAYVAGGSLRVIPLSGGTPRELVDNVFCCVQWAEDGFIYYSPGFRHVERIPAVGGEPEIVVDRTARQGVITLSNYSPVPHGDVGVYSAVDGRGTTWVEAIRPSTGEWVRLLEGLRPRVTESGHLVFTTLDGHLRAARFDSDELELTSPAVALDDAAVVARGMVPVYDIDGDGRLVYRAGPSHGSHELVWVTLDGEVSPVDPGESFNPGTGHSNIGWALSPDGSQIAFGQWAQGNEDIWVKRLPSGPPTRLTFDEARDLIPGWMPDGRTVSFYSNRSGGTAIWTKPADGSGDAASYLEGLLQPSWDRSGAWLAARSAALSAPGSPVSSRDLFAVDLREDRPVLISLGETEAAETDPALSPDGRWLAYVSDETGDSEVYVRGFPDRDAGRWRVSDGGGVSPAWSDDGRALYFIDVDGGAMRVADYAAVGSEFVLESVRTLFPIGAEFATSNLGHVLDVAPDGRFLMAREYAGGGGPDTLVVVRGFVDDLTARLGR